MVLCVCTIPLEPDPTSTVEQNMQATTRERDPAAPREPTLAPAEPFELVGSFPFAGFRLAYTEYGDGDAVVVLTHGLLMTRRMHRPLARELAAAGYHVFTLDLLGHGDSDRPPESWRHSMEAYAEQVIAFLEHIGTVRAVVGGTSLGANVALEVADHAPERVQGLLVEMPVLDNAVFAGLLAFPPLMFAARFAPLVVDSAAVLATLIPRGNQWVDVVTDTIRQEPDGMAGVLHGVLFGRIAPPRSARREIGGPALVIGHRNDPIHPFGDADSLAADMPHAEFVHARSPVELRFDPERLTNAIIGFVARCYGRSGASIPA